MRLHESVVRSATSLRITTVSHESALGNWAHSECVPTHLSGVVEKIWHFEGRMALLRERSFAKVYTEIILQLGPQFREIAHDGASGDLFPADCVGGLTTAPSVIEAPSERCHVIGIQLHAEGAFQLLASSAAEIANGTISLVDAIEQSRDDLSDACYHAPTAEARFDIVCEWIAKRLQKRVSAHAAVRWATTRLRESRGTTSIASLQEQLSLTKPRFVALFREQVGITPKHYARILRFRESLSQLQSGLPLSDAALSAGYYDQAHMYRDFRDFAHMTPAEFVAANRFPGSLSLSEPGTAQLD